MTRLILPSLASLALPLFALAAPVERPSYQIVISEINGPPVPGVRGSTHTLFGNHGDWKITERLWNAYAPAFDSKDWDNFIPEAHFEQIDLHWKDRKLLLRSRHRVVERDARNVVTSRGVESLVGRSKEAVLKADDPAYLRRREAFDALITECLTQQAADKAKYLAEKPRRNREQAGYLRSRETKGMLQAIFGVIYFGGLLLVVSLPWYGSLLWSLTLAEEKSRSRPGWLAAALMLSPLGWTAAIDLRNVRMWMIPLSILAPLLCALLLKALPRGEAAPATKAAARGLRALILVYAVWSAYAAGIYTALGMASGSSAQQTIGNLGAVRSALSIYYGDTNGAYPKDLAELTPKYLEKMPEVGALSRGNIIHLGTNRVTNFPAYEPDDRGGWGYVNEPLSPGGAPNPQYGAVFINCTHTDAKRGKSFSSY